MDKRTQLDRADRIGLYTSVAIVAIGAVLAIAEAVRRVLEVYPGTDVPVVVPLTGETAPLPLGPEGADVQATVETATVVVPDPADATLFALHAQPVWDAAMVCTILVLAAVFFLRLARGQALTVGTVRVTYAAVAVVALGWFVSTILTNMTTNGALSALSDYTYESVTFETTLAPVFVVLVLGAVAGALQIGERLQRDTEGLV